MTVRHPLLLAEIDQFLSETGLSESYFGKASTGNSELVQRLRNGGRVWPETEAKARSFILTRRYMARRKQHGRGGVGNQEAASKNKPQQSSEDAA